MSEENIAQNVEQDTPKPKKPKRRKFNADAFYDKYPHVVRGSVKDVEKNSVVDGVKAVHGRVCQIKCKETGVLRTINVQDAFQIFYCKEVQSRINKSKKKKAAKKPSQEAANEPNNS